VKLDRLVAKHQSLGRNNARDRIVQGRVEIDHLTEIRADREIDRFHKITLDGHIIQPGARRLHLMLHKPAGILSATTDPVHPTVIDLIDDPDAHTLHLAGRLDRATSGLILLTHDGRWSKALMHPDHKVPKTYLVHTRDPIPASAIEVFSNGFHFHTENITTLPAALEILTEKTARLTLHEGRYHQIKRMFHRIGNLVTALHRERIGNLQLTENLPPGAWRHLTGEEITAAYSPSPDRTSA